MQISRSAVALVGRAALSRTAALAAGLLVLLAGLLVFVARLALLWLSLAGLSAHLALLAGLALLRLTQVVLLLAGLILAGLPALPVLVAVILHEVSPGWTGGWFGPLASHPRVNGPTVPLPALFHVLPPLDLGWTRSPRPRLAMPQIRRNDG
ncbi:MAG TPA: hypothetical protein VFP14_08300, partial [Novosphingobium sp.]|nr:hypothetical protein [Novosphingobium sp.]